MNNEKPAPRLATLIGVFDAAMALEEEQAKHGTDAFSQERFDQLATALMQVCRRARRIHDGQRYV